MSLFSRRPASSYFDLLEAAAANATNAAALLVSLLEQYPDDADLTRQILLREQEGDRISQAILRQLSEGARSPLSRAATHSLATGIDDVVDFIEQVADCFGLYGIEAPMDPALALAKVLNSATEQLALAIGGLRDGASIRAPITEVYRLENEGDTLSREAIASLFAVSVDPMVVIRWKDIFEQLEHAIDSCKAVAHTLDGGSFDA
jgi:uncharacterized protein Yka (UPF0111/DUF47 family)